MDELLWLDLIDHTPLPSFSPAREGVKTLFMALRVAFPNFHVTIQEQIAEDEKVYCKLICAKLACFNFSFIAFTSFSLISPHRFCKFINAICKSLAVVTA